MNVKRTKSGIEVETAGLDQLDIFAAGHPAGRPYRIKQDGKHMLKLRAKKNQMVEVVGFAQGTVRQRRRILLIGERRRYGSSRDGKCGRLFQRFAGRRPVWAKASFGCRRRPRDRWSLAAKP